MPFLENETHFYHTLGLATLRRRKRTGGLPGRIGIKVGNIIRSRRNQGKCLFARNHKRNLYQRRLSPLHAERYGPPRPVMGGEWMMGKFATASALTLLALTVLLGAQGFAQATPAGQTPAAPSTVPVPAAQQPTAQQPASGQEPADEESTSRRRKERPHDYKNWTFNVGAGANVD